MQTNHSKREEFAVIGVLYFYHAVFFLIGSYIWLRRL